MNHIVGSPSLPIRTGFVKAVIELLQEGARRLRADGVVSDSTEEDDISELLDREMEDLHRGSASDIVSWSMREARRIADGSDEIVEVDFSFRWLQTPRDQRRFLAVEAKKVRGQGTSMAGPYVRKGVMRFVRGRYGRGHDYGVMLGYVLAGSADAAAEKIQDVMDREASDTREVLRFAPDVQTFSSGGTYTSRHRQGGTDVEITLVHVLVELVS